VQIAEKARPRNGTDVAYHQAMMTGRLASPTHAADSTPVLRWILRRRAATLTCEVNVTSNGAYDVCIVPHWDVSQSILERCGGATDALRRHAEIARDLRERGWVVWERVPVQQAQAA
jgi:hypothetical protein